MRCTCTVYTDGEIGLLGLGDGIAGLAGEILGHGTGAAEGCGEGLDDGLGHGGIVPVRGLSGEGLDGHELEVDHQLVEAEALPVQLQCRVLLQNPEDGRQGLCGPHGDIHGAVVYGALENFRNKRNGALFFVNFL